MTVVISLFSGSGVGKTTCAADLFSEMKYRKLHVEYVSEYVKKWAWQKRVPGKYDQAYLFGKQSQSESILYNNVDFIVTDSPILLSAYYEHHHLKREIVKPAVFNFLDYTKEEGVERINFFLRRNKDFDPRGRYETEEQAREIDVDMEKWLKDNDVPFTVIETEDRDRVDYIINFLYDKGYIVNKE